MSAAELSVWWAEVLSQTDVDARRLSMMWLDDQRRMLARVLSLDGVPPLPHPTVIQALLQIHDLFAERPEAADCHLAFALSRSGEARILDEDRAWAEALEAAMKDHRTGSWSLHFAAGGWLTPLVEPPTAKFDPRRVAIHSFQELLDRTWLRDQNHGHVDPVVGRRQSPLQQGD
jgi:hypothetical protein